MKVQQFLISIKPDFVFVIFIVPLFLGIFISTFFTDDFSPQFTSILLAIWVSTSMTILYTSGLANIVAKGAASVWNQVLSIGLLLASFLSFRMVDSPIAFYLFIGYFSSEMVRGIRITKRWLISEGISKSTFDGIILFTLVISPGIGIWSLHQRMLNVKKEKAAHNNA